MHIYIKRPRSAIHSSLIKAWVALSCLSYDVFSIFKSRASEEGGGGAGMREKERRREGKGRMRRGKRERVEGEEGTHRAGYPQ